jgi:hypothetical protein
MSPALLLTLLLSSLLATLPVRRLHQAGWSSGSLMTAWVVYVALIVMGVGLEAAARYVLPVLVVLVALPYAAGPSRLKRVGRLFGAQGPSPARPVINVTPPGGPDADEPAAEPAHKGHGRKPPVEYR